MKNFGKWGEEAAASFLMKKGCELIEKNWRSRQGEIDIVMRDGDTIVFVEVKTRRTVDFGYPEESLSVEKLDRLCRTCEEYLERFPEKQSYRIDCVAIIGNQKSYQISHIQNLQI